MTAVRASYALPGIFAPVEVDGRWLLDGALVNPIPVSVCRALGAHVVIAVNLNNDVFEPDMAPPPHEVEVADERALSSRLKDLPGADLVRQLFSHSNNEPSIFNVMARSSISLRTALAVRGSPAIRPT